MIVSTRSALHKIAQEAGLKVPFEAETYNWDLYGHFELFVASQLHAEVPNEQALIENAKLIGRLSEVETHTITRNTLLKLGFIVGKKVV